MRFIDALRASGVKKHSASRSVRRRRERIGTLRRTGLVVVNPPFTFEEEARELSAFLAQRLAQGPGAGVEIEWLSGE